MARAFSICAIVLLGVALLGYAWAAPLRAVLVVWDAKNDQALDTYASLVKTLKVLRASGQLKGAGALYDKFLSYDFNEASHQKALKELGVRRDQCPYVAVVQLDAHKIPQKILWGQMVTEVPDAMAGLKGYLGLAPAPVGGITRPKVITGTEPDKGGPPDGTQPPVQLTIPLEAMQAAPVAVAVNPDRPFPNPAWQPCTTLDGTLQALLPPGTYNFRRQSGLCEAYSSSNCAVACYPIDAEEALLIILNDMTPPGSKVEKRKFSVVSRTTTPEGLAVTDFLLSAPDHVLYLRAIVAGDRTYVGVLSGMYPAETQEAFRRSLVVRYQR